MDIRLRKLIVSIAACFFIFFATTNTTPCLAAAMSLTLDRDLYYQGDDIPIKYTIPFNMDEYEEGVRTSIAIYPAGSKLLGMNTLASKDVSEPSGAASGVWKILTRNSNPGRNITRDASYLQLGDRIAHDFTVRMRRVRSNVSPVEVQGEIVRHFRLRQPRFNLPPGALTIRGGSRFKPGDNIIADINISPSLMDISQFELELFLLNRTTSGGAIQPDYWLHIEEKTHAYILKPVEEMTIAKNKFLYPGIYELRLTRYEKEWESAGKYVVDAVRFETIVEPWPNAIDVVDSDNMEVGKDILVRLNREAIPCKPFESSYIGNFLKLRLYRVEEDTLDLTYLKVDIINDQAKLKHIEMNQNVGPDRDLIFEPVDKAGKYVFLLGSDYLINYGDTKGFDRNYIFDTFEVDITGRPDIFEPDKETANKLKPDPSKPYMDPRLAKLQMKTGNKFEFNSFPKQLEPHIGTGNKTRFLPGQKVPVEVYVDEPSIPGATVSASLHYSQVSERYNLGDQIKKWDVTFGKKMAWTLEDDLPIGSYVLSLKSKYTTYLGTERERIEKSSAFQIVPKFGEVVVNIKDKRKFLFGEKINMEIILPDTIDPEDFTRFRYHIIRKGGFDPGCARVRDEEIWTDRVTDLSNITFTAPFPGNYIVRVRAILSGMTPEIRGLILLSETSFTTDLKWEPEGLTLVSGKTVYDYGEDVSVRINVPKGLGLGSRSAYNFKNTKDLKYYLAVYRQGDVSYGGAYRYPAEIKLRNLQDNYLDEGDTLILNKKNLGKFLWPGSYELRLYNCDESRGGFVIARKTFEVIDSKSPFPPEKGKPGVRRPSEIEQWGIAGNLRAGEYLEPDTCNDSLLEPMDRPLGPDAPHVEFELHFLVKSGSEYVPVPPEGIKELKSDITVRIKLIYNSDPMKESETITVKSNTAEDEIQILARQTQDPKIFLSEPFILSPGEFFNE